MKYIILALLISSNACAYAYADTAVWTGKFELHEKKAYSSTWDCEYFYEGEKFWRLQESYCEKQIEAKYIEE